MMKCAAAVAGLLVGSVLSGAGYLESTASKVVAQPASAVQAIRLLLSLIPAGLIGAGMLILTRYTLTERRHAELVQDIKARGSTDQLKRRKG